MQEGPIMAKRAGQSHAAGPRGPTASWMLVAGRARRGLTLLSGQDLDRVDLGIVDHAGEANAERPVGDGCGERLVQSRVGSGVRLGEDIEVGEDRLIVDSDVEDALAGGGPVQLREFQVDPVGAIWHTELVAEVAVALGLIQRRIESPGNSSRNAVGGAARVARVSLP